jgi:HK97 family phage portal protein
MSDLTAEQGNDRTWIVPRSGSDAGGGNMRVNWPETWFQSGYNPPPSAAADSLAFPAVFASIDIISSDIARLPIQHWKDDGEKRTLVRSSFITDVMDTPNEYQTGFDLMKQLIASQLYRGNGYLFPKRNGRHQIDELHCLFPDHVSIYKNRADYYYRVSMEPLAELDESEFIPPRNMFHHRMLTLLDPLYGITPLLAAATSSAAGLAILRQSSNFFGRMARPSGVIQTTGRLDDKKAEAIKERWRRAYVGAEGSGDVAVLEEGLEWKPLTMTAVDAQLIDQLRYSVEDIARVYRLPLFMLGDLTKVSYSSSEQLTRIYYQGCLSAHMESLEARLTHLFGLSAREEYLEFDLEVLFRTEMQARIETLAKAIQGGLRTPNEARRMDGLNPIGGGDAIFMQQQMVPVEALAMRTDLNPKPMQQPAPQPARAAAQMDPSRVTAGLMNAVFSTTRMPAPQPLPSGGTALAHRQRERRIIHGRLLRAS